jgi:hypothetical protein
VVVLFVTPKIFFFILVPYFVKQGNELCTETELIKTVNECKVAIEKLSLTYTKATFSSSAPKGCYVLKGGPASYWNWYGYNSEKRSSNSHSICRIGE